MFSIYCPQEATEILLGPRRIERLEHTEYGIVIHWRCYCGTTGHSRAGRRSARPQAPAAA